MATDTETIVSRILALKTDESLTVQALDHSLNKARTYALRVEDVETTSYEYCVYASAEDGGWYVIRLSRPTEQDDWELPTVSALSAAFTLEINQLH